LTLRLYFWRFPHAVTATGIVLVPSLLLSGLGGAFGISSAAFLGLVAPSIAPQGAPVSDVAATLLALCFPALGLILGVFWPWAEGALALSTLEAMAGQRLGLRAAYGRTGRQWLSLWLANLLAQLGIALPFAIAGLIAAGGMLALLAVLVFGVFGANVFEQIPPAAFVAASVLGASLAILLLIVGVNLAIQWSLRAPAIAHEGLNSIAGLGRSAALVRGHRWRMFGRYLSFALLECALIVLPTVAISALLAASFFPQTFAQFGAATLPDSQAALVTIGASLTVTSTVMTLLVTPLRVIFTAVNYADLRIRKGESLAVQPASVATLANANALTESLSSHATPKAQEADWRMLDPARMTPAQRVSLLFKRMRAEGETSETLTEMAFALYEVGDWGGALDAFTRARTLDPNNPRTAYGLMVLYYERRDLATARQMMQAYLRLETSADALQATRNNPRFRDLL